MRTNICQRKALLSSQHNSHVSICANSSQAKGRVERVNKTLQDRLIKEMRLQNVSSIAEANQWIESFMSDFNRRFSRPAKYPKDLHRPVTQSLQDLNDIFAWQELRTLSKALTFQYDKVMYIIDPTDENTRIVGEKITVFVFAWQESRKLSKTLTFRYDKMMYLVESTEENARVAGEKIMVYDYPDGTLAFKYGYRSLNYQVFDKLECIDQGQIVDNKRLGAVLKLAQDKMDELERFGKRERSKKMPKRRAQARVQEQLRAINPVLVNPDEFRASLKR